MNIAVIILTFNEELNLSKALESVKGWSQEVYIVDSFSTDRTVEIALSKQSDGVSVVQHAFEDYSSQWNWALENLPIKSEWTLKLDADERLTDEFKAETLNVIKTVSQEVEGISFRRRFFFMGKFFRWGGFSDNYDLRMWKTGCAKFESRPINEHVLVNGLSITIKSFVDHHNFKSVSDWLDKHNRYSSLEAQNIIRGNMTGDIKPRLFGSSVEQRMWFKVVYFKLPFNNIIYLVYKLFIKMGFLDGYQGIVYSFLYTYYLFLIQLKVKEYEITGTYPTVIWPSRGYPHSLLLDSENKNSSPNDSR